MKINTNVNGVDISITLTKDQLAEIERQTSKKLTAENIDYDSAKQLLKDNNIEADPKGFYNGLMLKIITIIKAINFIDNDNKEWIFKLNDGQRKYYPWFEEKSSGLVLGCVGCYVGGRGLPAGFYFKKESTCRIIVNRFNNDYNKIMG